MKYKTYVFDLDGTILDNSENILNFINLTLNDFSIPSVTLNECLKFIGPPLKDTLKNCFNMDDEQAEKASEIYKNYSLNIDPARVKVYEGMHELLARLKKSGAKIAISTLKIDEIAKKLLRECGLDLYFDCIMGTGVDGKLGKTALIKKSLDYLNVSDLSEVVMIGDSEFDKFGAKEIGIDFIGVTYGFGFTKDENENMAESVFELEEFIFND